jgi:diazepam-binding inhibitor (GABA receptor modulator, acyl-CoA-binding protein)
MTDTTSPSSLDPALQARLDAAAAASRQLPERPANLTLLRIYALYKQATQGDAGGERPSGFIDRAKHDAWASLSGTAPAEAAESYIALIESLQ